MNLRELSETLGLSQTTVSRALNGFPEVSEKTRARVRSAAELHGYRPSAAARRLATGQSGTLGVIFPRERNMLGDLLFTEFLGGCVERSSELGYDITLAMASGAYSEETVYRRAVRSARVDAMILSSPLLQDARVSLLKELEMPFIVHGRTQCESPYAFLDIDNEGAIYSATRLLTDLGHRRIALLNGERTYNYANDRALGYARAMAEAGGQVLPALQIERPMTDSVGYCETLRLLQDDAGNRPTAFICSSIAQAQGVSRAVREAGLQVGRDISIIAHDDRVADIRAEQFETPLTATQSSIGDAGRKLAELLITMIRNPEEPLPREVWPVDLVVRASTGPAPRH